MNDLFIWPLSKREHEILSLKSTGMEYKEIAALLGIAPQTVKFHLRHVRLKFHESHATLHKVIAECFRTGYLDPFEEIV